MPVIVPVFVLLRSPTLEAWQVIGHYQITVEAAGQPQAAMSYLPDSWPSHRGIIGWFAITEWFAWSHAVLLTGRTATVPNVPAYPTDDRDPGTEMYRLYKRGQTRDAQAYPTLLAFIAHNSQDRVVHYQYFRGGSRAAWVEEHAYKEEWADCWIYRLRMNGVFDETGSPRGLPGIMNKGSTDLIIAAQSSFVASRLPIDVAGRTLLTSAESASEVRQRFADGERDIGSYFGAFGAQRCRWLQSRYRRNYNWTLDELERYYKLSVDATRQRISHFPP